MEILIFSTSSFSDIQCLDISLKENLSMNSIDTINSSCNTTSNNNNNGDGTSLLMVPTQIQLLLLEFCLCISAICLTMHLIVYGFIPKLRNTPGKCLMSLSLSLLLAAVMFVLSLHIQPSPSGILCISVAIIRFYSFLATFFWMNVMAFDIYRTFATKANLSFKINCFKSSLKSEENVRFICYSLYAWLMPSFIITISLVVQSNIPYDSPYNPSYGSVVCGISHYEALVIYFMLPVGTILTINVILFIITARKLKLTADETRFATKSKAKYKLLLYMKLILVLGLTWIFWFIVLFTQIPLFTYPTIILDGLNGAFIFVAFTVKKNVYRLILLRIKYLRGHKHISVSMIRLNSQIINNRLYARRDTQITLWSDDKSSYV